MNATFPGVLDVVFTNSGGGRNFCIVQIKKAVPWDPWQVLNAVAGYDPSLGKITIVVDDDIDPTNEDDLWWAVATRCDPASSIDIFAGGVGQPP